MTNNINPKVDFFFEKAPTGSKKDWREALIRLRMIVLDCGLTEQLKWGAPCYTSDDKNIVLIHAFKEYAALLFFKGALLKDPKNILIQQTEHVQSARQIRFADIREILDAESVVKSYIFEAIEVEKSGVKVPLKKTAEYTIPDEFASQLDSIPDLNKAFHALTPGRQRAYLLHFSAPKQVKTRIARVEKSMSEILQGRGLND